MSNKFLVVAASVLSLWATGAASAADLPVKARPYVAPMPVYSWSGFYFGGHVGGTWGTTETSLIDGSDSIPWSSRTSNGFLGGGQIGLNYQVGWAVLGIEGSMSWTDAKGEAPCGFGNVFACTTKSNWIGTATGRIGGLVMDRTLVYVKGGVAWKDTDYSGRSTFIGNDVWNASDTRVGALFGAGAEYAFAPNWTAFLEYNYMDFGTERLTYTSATAPSFDFDNNDKLHLVKAGLNYRLNWFGR